MMWNLSVFANLGGEFRKGVEAPLVCVKQIVTVNLFYFVENTYCECHNWRPVS